MDHIDPTLVDDALTELSVDELTLLKQRADTMGLRYSPKIGVDALKAKIQTALTGEGEEFTEADENEEETKLSPAQEKAAKLARMRKEQLRLVRLRIANLNPQKADLQGEIFTTGNRILGTVRKFIPYGEATDDGYHVPFIIYQQMKDRKFLSIRTRTVKGQIQVETKWVPEFALEVLPNLTEEEIKNLAAAQTAGGNID